MVRTWLTGTGTVRARNQNRYGSYIINLNRNGMYKKTRTEMVFTWLTGTGMVRARKTGTGMVQNSTRYIELSEQGLHVKDNLNVQDHYAQDVLNSIVLGIIIWCWELWRKNVKEHVFHLYIMTSLNCISDTTSRMVDNLEVLDIKWPSMWFSDSFY